MKKYIKLMRVHHYIKNLLILLPLVFSGNIFDSSYFVNIICGFVSFCLVSSIVYIINDIQDVESDKNHSTKCKRPIASGAVSISKAKNLVRILTIIILILLMLIKINTINYLLLITAYFVINIFYSVGLKNVPIVDIAILVSGFILRVLFGSAITGIEVSNWLYLTVMSISFYLALGKRRNEIKKQKDTRSVLQFYNFEFLDKNMYISMACSIVFYSLWCVDVDTISRYQTNALVWTVPIVMLIAMKYSLITEGTSDGDPVEVILGDKTLILMILVYVAVLFGIIYF
ncbi:MAG: UbiA prenyltransferase family protein [Anaerorhabdus sp.]|uniref:UbiA prenyltransferase family protein n=1 Tax=Anaerorhabdus sp. TaxID=1872524 RepID=UPI002FC7FED5